MKFSEYITEAKEGKNVHLEHLEDNVLNNGVSGAREAINFLRSLRKNGPKKMVYRVIWKFWNL